MAFDSIWFAVSWSLADTHVYISLQFGRHFCCSTGRTCLIALHLPVVLPTAYNAVEPSKNYPRYDHKSVAFIQVSAPIAAPQFLYIISFLCSWERCICQVFYHFHLACWTLHASVRAILPRTEWALVLVSIAENMHRMSSSSTLLFAVPFFPLISFSLVKRFCSFFLPALPAFLSFPVKPCSKICTLCEWPRNLTTFVETSNL